MNPQQSLDFNNTEIAFRSQSDKALRHSYWLFRMIGVPTLAKLGPAMVSTALRLHVPITWAIRKTIFRQFCGGESIQDCQKTVTQLRKFHIKTILDYSAEGKQDETEFERTTAEILSSIERAAKSEDIAFCVFKTTGLARFELLEAISSQRSLTLDEENEWTRVKRRVNQLCKAAYDHKCRIFIDAEETWVQPAIDDLALAMMRAYNRERAAVYTTLQMYRVDRLEYLHTLYQRAEQEGFFLGVKLVRGAYMEKERERAKQQNYSSPIQPSKAATDKSYDTALSFVMKHLDRMALCAGTHNEASSKLLAELMAEQGISKSDPRVYFSQLYGMSDNLTYNLAFFDFNVAKYIPYGPVDTVLPYLFRRAQENTSIQKQTGRQLALIEAEMKRRHLV